MLGVRTVPDEKQVATVVFAHHPCPDGIASTLMLAQKLGTDELVSYNGLNHSDIKSMDDNIQNATQSLTHCKRIIFADIVPPFLILQKLLETTEHEIILLDHHATAIAELAKNNAFIKKYIESGRLIVHLNITLSGAGIAHDYVHGTKERPQSIALTQTIDLLTATGNPEVISQFKINKSDLNAQSNRFLSTLSEIVPIEQIKKNIVFYVFAAIYDFHMETLFKQHKGGLLKPLMKSVALFFKQIDEEGLSSLLNEDMAMKFRQQINLQEKALQDSITLPPLTKGGPAILFINIDIKSGRTLDPLIAQFLKQLPSPTIAMIVNLKENDFQETFYISLRAASDDFNLVEIAAELKNKNFAVNAGGHARASALQLNKKQMDELMVLVKQQKESKNTTGSQSGFGLKLHSGPIPLWGARPGGFSGDELKHHNSIRANSSYRP